MDDNKKIPVIAVVGPTASGKTVLSIAIAKAYGGEIVSADSMQIYKGMDIATAKPDLTERDGIAHHLMDFLDPEEPFSVSDYVQLANQAIDDIHSRGHIPVLVGGTGLYVDSLLENITFTETETDLLLREQLRLRAVEEGGESLLAELAEFDPSYADTLHPNNINRIIRGIEIYRTTGMTMSEHRIRSRQVPSRFAPCLIGLNYTDRKLLYQRIDQRVDLMVEQGLLQEAQAVLQQSDLKTAVQAIGYKELKPYFAGECSLDEALDNLKRQTRRYAKRQLTWFRKNSQIQWIYPDQMGSEGELFFQAQKLIDSFLNSLSV